MSPDALSVGIMCSCLGRGAAFHYKHWNVESDAFRAQFPATPLFGFFGDGEIGMDTCPPPGKLDPNRQPDDPQLQHYYSSAFMIIGVRPQTSN
jgi:F-box protein 22